MIHAKTQYQGLVMTDFCFFLSPAQTFKHEISFRDYAFKEVREGDLINLVVVTEEAETGKRTQTFKEFNIISPTLSSQV